MRDRGSSRRVVAETSETRKKVGAMRAEAAGLVGKRRSTRRQEVPDDIAALLAQQSLAEWVSFLKKM